MDAPAANDELGTHVSNQDFFFNHSLQGLIAWEEQYIAVLRVMREAVSFLRHRTSVCRHFPRFGKGVKRHFVTEHPERLRHELPTMWGKLQQVVDQLDATHSHLVTELRLIVADDAIPRGAAGAGPRNGEPTATAVRRDAPAAETPAFDFSTAETEAVSSAFLHLLTMLRPLYERFLRCYAICSYSFAQWQITETAEVRRYHAWSNRLQRQRQQEERRRLANLRENGANDAADIVADTPSVSAFNFELYMVQINGRMSYYRRQFKEMARCHAIVDEAAVVRQAEAQRDKVFYRCKCGCGRFEGGCMRLTAKVARHFDRWVQNMQHFNNLVRVEMRFTDGTSLQFPERQLTSGLGDYDGLGNGRVPVIADRNRRLLKMGQLHISFPGREDSVVAVAAAPPARSAADSVDDDAAAESSKDIRDTTDVSDHNDASIVAEMAEIQSLLATPIHGDRARQALTDVLRDLEQQCESSSSAADADGIARRAAADAEAASRSAAKAATSASAGPMDRMLAAQRRSSNKTFYYCHLFNDSFMWSNVR